MQQDRRQYPRYIPDSALLVSLGTSRRGFLSDLSEGGMAFDGFLPQDPAETLQLSFRLPDGCEVIEAMAEVVWTNDSRHRTGVRFTELAERTRRQIRQWLSARIFRLGVDDLANLPEPRVSSVRREVSLNRAPQIPEGAMPAPKTTHVSSTQEHTSGYDSTYSLGTALAVIVLCSMFVGLGYYLPNIALRHTKGAQKMHPAATSTGLEPAIAVKKKNAASIDAASAAPLSEASAPASKLNSTGPTAAARQAGFVLQLAAMTHRENADALTEALHRKNFPAFVLARDGDPFYRVDVGPYPDAAHARSVEGELKTGGFHTVLEKQLTASAH